MIKRLSIVLLVTVLVAVTGVLTLPWWLGTALRGPAEDYGVTYGSYQRVGYARWALHDVVMQRPGITLRIDRIELPHPLSLWWHKANAGPVAVGTWRADFVEVEDSPAESNRRPGGDVLLAAFDQITAMLPPVAVAAGEVSWSEGNALASVGPILMDRDGIHLERARHRDLEVSGQFDRAARAIELRSGAHAAILRMILREGGNTLAVDGSWQGHPVTGSVGFDDDGRWMPSVAHLETGDWRLTGSEIGLGGRIESVDATAVVDWNDSRYRFEVLAAGEPVDGIDLPSIDVDVRGSGDEAALTIESLTVRLPGLTTELEEPFVISRGFARNDAVSRFRLEADLAALPWGRQSGHVKGDFTLSGDGEVWPRLEGKLKAEHLAVGEYRFPAAELAAEIDWPRWRIDEVRLEDEAGSAALLRAEGDGGTVTSSLNRITLQEGSVRRWLPDDVSFSEMTIEGTVLGSLDDPRAELTASSDRVQIGFLEPLKLTLELKENELAAIASGESRGNEIRAILSRTEHGFDLKELELRQDDQILLRAGEGASVAFAPEWELKGLRLAGLVGSFDIDQASLSNGSLRVDSDLSDWSWLRAWWRDAPALLPRIEMLNMTVGWSPEGVNFLIRGRAILELAEVGDVVVELRANGDRDAVRIEQFEVGKADRRFAAVSGTLPVRLQIGETLSLGIEESGPVALQARLLPNPEFWQAWGALTGVTLRAPDVELSLSGAWPQLSGDGRIALKSLRVSERWGGVAWPLIEDLDAALKGDGEGLRIEHLTARIDGNAMSLSGRLPLGADDLKTLRAQPLVYLRENGEVKLEMVNADMGGLARLLPDYLVPAGRASVSLDFGRGGELDGSVSLRGVVTRPLGPLGVLQDITADLRFTGRRVTISQLQAIMGGQPLRLTGSAEWDGAKDVSLDLHLKGANLPLVRRTGMLLRGDLDLVVETTADSTTVVKGNVLLHDGLMLADVGSLVPRGGERRSSRPPYFSVEVEPFSAWRLDVAVDGEDFMRLRTPLLNGVATVHARLDGTLLNPRAIGEVSLSEAVVKLPFANFVVEEAVARLTPTNPYEPQLQLRAEGKRLGYDLLMELAGTASEPRLELSSEPSLPASDVLLFVMAGVAPQNEVTYSQSRRALQIGLYLGRELVGDLLGLDAADRLAVTTGEKLSRRGKETYRFGYLLDDRWTLTGEYDEFDYYNAGIKWRWYPWKSDADDADVEEKADTP